MYSDGNLVKNALICLNIICMQRTHQKCGEGNRVSQKWFGEERVNGRPTRTHGRSCCVFSNEFKVLIRYPHISIKFWAIWWSKCTTCELHWLLYQRVSLFGTISSLINFILISVNWKRVGWASFSGMIVDFACSPTMILKLPVQYFFFCRLFILIQGTLFNFKVFHDWNTFVNSRKRLLNKRKTAFWFVWKLHCETLRFMIVLLHVKISK